MAEFEIVNVVGTVDFQQRIALGPLADSLTERDEVNQVEYDPSELHLIHSWLSEDGIYVGFYTNGTCTVAGAGSLDEFYGVSDAIGDVVDDIVDFKTETTVNITNILSITKIDNIPSLEAIAVGLGLEQTEYEPEQFPALIYRREDAVLLIFSSGKIACTGSTNLDQISSAINGTTKQIDALTV